MTFLFLSHQCFFSPPATDGEVAIVSAQGSSSNHEPLFQNIGIRIHIHILESMEGEREEKHYRREKRGRERDLNKNPRRNASFDLRESFDPSTSSLATPHISLSLSHTHNSLLSHKLCGLRVACEDSDSTLQIKGKKQGPLL